MRSLFLITFSSILFGTIINVPHDQLTIQTGIDSASNGDTVLVQPGTYVENINFKGKNIVVGSLTLTTGDTSCISQTVIDGDNSGTVVTFETGEDSSAKLYGFTLRNGHQVLYAAGILCINNSNPSLEHLILNDNHGNGIYCRNQSNPIIKNSVIFNTTGVGIASIESNPQLIGLTIIENNSEGVYGYDSDISINNSIISRNVGHGIACTASSNLYISNVIISDNGGFSPLSIEMGIYCYSSNVNISNSIISGNNGYGIYCNYNFNLTVNNVTVADNFSDDRGGGIYCEAIPYNVILTNSIIWNNFPLSIESDQSTLDITYSCIQQGWEGEGNINQDPLFCNPDSGDYYLANNSPCVNTGENESNMGARGVGCDSILSTQEHRIIPIKFILYQNYPNPFNPVTTIRYDLPEQAHVRLAVYDLLGREIAVLIDKIQPSGFHHTKWDAQNVASGIYFYQIITPKSQLTIKLVILK